MLRLRGQSLCGWSMDAGDVSWGLTSQSSSPIKAFDWTLKQWGSVESAQPRRSVMRFDLESSLWLERGGMTEGKKLDTAAGSQGEVTVA